MLNDFRSGMEPNQASTTNKKLVPFRFSADARVKITARHYIDNWLNFSVIITL